MDAPGAGTQGQGATHSHHADVTADETADVTADDFPDGRWRARWIWSRAAPVSLRANTEPVIDRDAARGYVLLRRTFIVAEVPDRAPARVTADSRYVLWVNGTEVSRGPVRGTPQRLHYDLVDLAPHLLVGDNVVSTLGRFYGRAMPWWIPSKPTFGLGGGTFLFEAALGEAHDPATEWIVSDATWLALEPDAWDDVRAGGIGDMPAELCDARELPVGWHENGFDASSWSPAEVLETNYVGYAGDPHPPTHPYGPLLPRPIPKLTGAVRRGSVVAVGTASAVDIAHDNVSSVDPIIRYGAEERVATLTDLTRTDSKTVPEPSVPEPSVPEPSVPEPSVPEPSGSIELPAPERSGDVHIVVVDFGEQVAGHVGIEIDAAGGTRINAKAAEAIDTSSRLQALQQHNGFRYVARGNDDVFETFDKIGLRFLGLAVRSDGPVTIRAVTVRERLFPRHTATSHSVTTHSASSDDQTASTRRAPGSDGGRPVTATGRSTSPPGVPFFACSDPLLDDIWRIGRRTVDLCSQDAYLDCPSREQRGWTGDSVVHQMVDLTTNTDWSLARWNVELGASPRRDGMLPMVAGGDMEYHDSTFIPDWALHWVRSLRNLYEYTGDRESVGALLPVAERLLRWFVPFQDHDGLLDNVTGWVIIDWSAVHGNGKSAALNGLWARALADFTWLAESFRDLGRAEWAHSVWARVNEGFEQFWDAERGVYVDNIIGTEVGRATSQHGNAAALVGGLVPVERHIALIDTITDPARLEHAAWLMPGRQATIDGAGDMYAGFDYLVMGPPEPWWDVDTRIVAAQPFYRYVVHDAVALAGAADRLPDLCRDWSVLMARSATTWSEVWYGGSYCHAWCSTPTRDLIRYTLGVTPATPGFADARIAPALGDLAWAEGAVPTPSGLIHLRVEPDQVEIDSPIPFHLHASQPMPPGHHVVPRSTP